MWTVVLPAHTVWSLNVLDDALFFRDIKISTLVTEPGTVKATFLSTRFSIEWSGEPFFAIQRISAMLYAPDPMMRSGTPLLVASTAASSGRNLFCTGMDIFHSLEDFRISLIETMTHVGWTEYL